MPAANSVLAGPRQDIIEHFLGLVRVSRAVFGHVIFGSRD